MLQDINANAVCIQITVNSMQGVCNVKLLNELADAVNKVQRRYEAKFEAEDSDAEFDYTNYILDKDGVAIY
jgi:hypothetical protein